MTTPAAKKQKTANAPIVFTCPGLVPDVSLKVFDDWEFHVHSVLLKVHSGFFRKSFDWADNAWRSGAIATSSQTTGMAGAVNAVGIRYEMVTQMEKDGKGWHLVEKKALVSHFLFFFLV
jgi:hypothetical protein